MLMCLLQSGALQVDSSPRFRKAQNDKKATLSVFKLPFDKDGASASDDKAVFIDDSRAVVVVVVVVKGVKDIFYAHSNHAHIFVKAHTHAKVAYDIRF